jgi:ABC-2 type transport system permease protein
VWGLLAGVRAFRTEEDSGRTEFTLAQPVSRRTMYGASLTAIAAGGALLWLAAWIGLVLGGLPIVGSAYLALALSSVVPVFAGIGAIVSQLVGSHRTALALGTGLVGVAFALRAVADIAGIGWLRWLTPLGWAEELRPFTGADPAVILLPLLATVLLLTLAAGLARRRDIGTGLVATHESASARTTLLGSPMAQALRSELGSLGVWSVSLGVFALISGVIAKTVTAKGVSPQLQHELAKLGTSIFTPAGYLSFSMTLYILLLSLFACAQLGAIRHEETEGRLETLFALPVARRRWLSGRLLLAAASTVVLSLLIGALSWVGAVSQGVPLSLAQMLAAGANCLPTALLFLGLGALAYAALPRASGAVAYGLVTLAFLWNLVGSLLGLPPWMAKLTPFAHVGLMPSQPFELGAALVMLVIAAASTLAALAIFSRRDLTGA